MGQHPAVLPARRWVTTPSPSAVHIGRARSPDPTGPPHTVQSPAGHRLPAPRVGLGPGRPLIRGGFKAGGRLVPPGRAPSTMLALLVPLLLLAGGCHAAVLPGGSRVVNGQDAVPYSWPWQISLQYERDGTFRHTCGGTLIAPDWVMTAAHCISSTLTYEVVLGEYDMSSAEGPEQRIPVAADDIFVHPKWNSFCVACGNDIALLKLRRNAVLNDYVQTGRLPPAGTVLPNGYPCYLSGWGRLTTGGPLPDKLQDALMPVVDHEQCTQPDWWGSLAIRTTMICAGGAEQAGCNGDSGGPLNCQAEDGHWEVHGIASFVSALGCDTPKKPTVFTRVSAFEDWIAETMANSS
uniref:Peptidase S1 domain-containing protein n=2 Tax=Meleagris gallopavo TaxID=9103 RepID=G1N5J9_MELGA